MAKTMNQRSGLLLLPALTLLVWAATRSLAEDDAPPARDGVFVHISHATDAHRPLMGLKMATVMADGHDVLVYLDVEGVHLVVNGERGRVLGHPAFGDSVELLGRLREKGVGVYACPSCLKAAGFGPGDLIEGVQVANKEAFFSFTRGRILSLDY